MVNLTPLGLWQRFLGLPNDSRTKTLIVAFLVAAICAAFVSFTAVLLRPVQQAHIDRAREASFSEMISALPGLADILRAQGADTLDTVLVDLAAGEIVDTAAPSDFDAKAARNATALSTPLPPEDDPAGIGRRPDIAPAHLLYDGNRLVLVVLPVYATGYQSTIEAYLALEGDLNTIAALNIHEQGETPGLGARIADPAWQGQWAGRQIADTDGNIQIAIVHSGADGPFQVDGITGATRSVNAVGDMVRFWLGPNGFGPFLSTLKGEAR